MSTKLTKMASQNNHLKSFWHVFNNLLRGICDTFVKCFTTDIYLFKDSNGNTIRMC